jgi:ParB family chromosome partitioning protein
MRNIVSISPFRARMWALHDRLDHHVNEDTCKAEIQSFMKHGQLVPALGRVLRGDADYDVELIYGARRLFVARHVNKPLLVDMREMSDKEAIVAMDIENRQRADVSPYERGVSYARWLRSGHFGSQDDIARVLKISSSQVSRLLRLARLPSVILNAFSSPLEICEAWGLDIMDALDDAQRRERTIQAARAIGASDSRPAAREVYRQLMVASRQGRRPKPVTRDEVVKDDDGTSLFRIRHRSRNVSLVLPTSTISPADVANIRGAIIAILHHANTQALDSKRPRLFRASAPERRSGAAENCGEALARVSTGGS